MSFDLEIHMLFDLGNEYMLFDLEIYIYAI